MLLLTPGGPMILEVVVTIDGRPFQTAREKLVDDLLAMGDSNSDGQATWEEAKAHRRFATLQAALQGVESEEERQRRIDAFDRDKDGLLTRDEADRFISQVAGAGSSFLLTGSSYYSAGRYRSPVWDILDTDQDGAVSAGEWTLAGARLRLRDLDGNDLVDQGELNDAPAMAMENQPARREMDDGGPRRAMLLGPQANWVSVSYSLEELYRVDGGVRKESFPLAPSLFDAMDLNGNKMLDKSELERFNRVTPQLVLEANFGRAGERPLGLQVRQVAAELQATVGPLPNASGVLVQLADFELQLLASDFTPAQDFQAQAKAALDQFDADKNGYLDLPEIEKIENNEQLNAENFKFADSDNDEKLYPAELAAYIEREQAPTLNRIQATANEPEDGLFAVLDMNRDRRLSPRELRGAAERLTALDANQDGQLTRNELPAAIQISFERGDRQPAGAVQVNRLMTSVALSNANGPAWFAGMDRNGDGELGPGEFLGTSQQFELLDANRDGFIDAGEATNASAGPK